MSTGLPSTACVPGDGCWPTTVPWGRDDDTITGTAVNLALANTASASASLSPVTFGTTPLCCCGADGNPSAGRRWVTWAMKSCQISAGMVPPNISGTPSTLYMETSPCGYPTHTAVEYCGT